MLQFKNDNSIDKQEEILARLKRFNQSKCRWLHDTASHNSDEMLNKHANFLVFDNDKLVGGAIGIIQYNWYHLDLLYVDERYRRHHVGTDLINCIKKISLQYELTGIKLETWDFQARDFYVKNGFTIFGELRDCPPGTIVFYLKYTFKNEEKIHF